MDYVGQRNLLAADTRVNLLRNTLVLIAPSSSKATLKIAPGFGLAAALGTEKLAMANPDSVPAGKYGKSALEKLGVWTSVEKQVARAENVRAALALVSRGEAPFGIVYSTDALSDKGVKIVDTFPPDSYPPIVYPAALLGVQQVDGGQAAARLPSRRARPRDLGEIRVRVGSVSHARTQPGRGRNPGVESSRRGRERHLQPADRDRRGLRTGTLLVPRKDAGRCDRASAARAAARRRGLCAAGALRQARTHREPARRVVRDRVRVPLDRARRWPPPSWASR